MHETSLLDVRLLRFAPFSLVAATAGRQIVTDAGERRSRGNATAILLQTSRVERAWFRSLGEVAPQVDVGLSTQVTRLAKTRVGPPLSVPS